MVSFNHPNFASGKVGQYELLMIHELFPHPRTRLYQGWSTVVSDSAYLAFPILLCKINVEGHFTSYRIHHVMVGLNLASAAGRLEQYRSGKTSVLRIQNSWDGG